MRRNMNKFMLSVLALLLAVCGLHPGLSARAAVNDYVTVTKTINPNTITTEGEAEVSLQIKGTPPVNVVIPNDVILIIDKSGSMLPQNNNGEDKMKNAKEAAKGFIDLMDMTKHRVGIVDFSSSTNIGHFDLTTDKTAAKNYIDQISANGSTATGDAIQTAVDMLTAQLRPEAQPVIVLLTDGDATQPTNNPYQYAKDKAQEAKDQGVIFYTIALLKPTENPDTSGPNILLKEMATTAAHHHFVLGSTGLSDIYAAIVREIGLASAYNVSVTDNVTSDFEIVPGSYDNNIPKPTVTGNTLNWQFNELKDSTLTLTYKIRPVNKNKTGTMPTSTSSSIITYKDYAGADRSKAIPNVNLTVKWPAPVITSIVDNSGHPNGGNVVTITGNYFKPGATVTFGTVAATNVQVKSATEITATVPANPQGTVTVTVKNTDNQTATTQYQYKANPEVTSITPTHGPLAGGTIVYIQGNYFMKGVTAKFGDNLAASYSYTNSRSFAVTAPAGAAAGPVDVVVTNPDGTTITIPAGFTYDEPPVEKPVVTGVSPNSGLTTGGEVVYLTGQNLTGNMTVLFGTNPATIQSVVSSTRIAVIVPAAAQAGAVDVTVQDSRGTTVLAQAYTYNDPVYPAPTLTSITPNTGYTTGGNTVTLVGTNFRTGLKVYLGDNEAALSGSPSSTKITVTVPAVSQAGKVTVRVVNPDGKEASLVDAYEYTIFVPEPVTVTNLGVTSGKLAGGESIYVYGTNFKSGAIVLFGSKAGTSVNVVSSTRLSVTVPPGDALGTVDVTVTNKDGGTGTLPQAYTYTAVTPTISSLSPNSGVKDKSTPIYINGTNFEANTMTVTVGGVSVPYSFVNSTRISITVPPSSTTGVVPITVTLAVGTSASADFTYTEPQLGPKPVVTALSPNNGSAAGGNSIYVLGSNFVSGAKVYIGGVQSSSVSFVSSSRLAVKIPAGTPGPVELKVVNPDGQESNVITYTYT